MCGHAKTCWNKETTCKYLHDCSLADKIHYATIHNVRFIHPFKSVPSVPAVPSIEPKPDMIFMLQVEKAILRSEQEAIDILQKKLDVKMMEFRKKASDFWEVGSLELEL